MAEIVVNIYKYISLSRDKKQRHCENRKMKQKKMKKKRSNLPPPPPPLLNCCRILTESWPKLQPWPHISCNELKTLCDIFARLGGNWTNLLA